MPRRSSGGRAAPRPVPVRNPPMPVSQAPSPAPVQSGGGGSVLGGIGSTIAEGVAFGTGSAVAHRAVDAVMGPRIVSTVAPAPVPTGSSTVADACSSHSKAFQECLNSTNNDISKCQFYMDMLAECKKSFSGSSMVSA